MTFGILSFEEKGVKRVWKTPKETTNEILFKFSGRDFVLFQSPQDLKWDKEEEEWKS